MAPDLHLDFLLGEEELLADLFFDVVESVFNFDYKKKQTNHIQKLTKKLKIQQKNPTVAHPSQIQPFFDCFFDVSMQSV